MADEEPAQPQRNWGLTGAERAEKDAARTVFVRALAPEVDDVVSRAVLAGLAAFARGAPGRLKVECALNGLVLSVSLVLRRSWRSCLRLAAL